MVFFILNNLFICGNPGCIQSWKQQNRCSFAMLGQTFGWFLTEENWWHFTAIILGHWLKFKIATSSRPVGLYLLCYIRISCISILIEEQPRHSVCNCELIVQTRIVTYPYLNQCEATLPRGVVYGARVV